MHHAVKNWIALTSILFFSCSAMSIEPFHAGLMPPADGKVWRFGIYQGGEYIDYQDTLRATVNGLVEIGWIEPLATDIPPGTSAKAIWEILSTRRSQRNIRFIRDAFYSAGWDQKRRKEIRATLLERLNSKRDIDLVLVLGTWAGKDLATEEHAINTIIMSVSDAVGAGIVKTPVRSGFAHVHAQVDPGRDERQLRIFHKLAKFEKLGMIYENTEEGKSYAALDIVEKLSGELEFEIVTCHAQSDIPDVAERERQYRSCLSEISPRVDALYVTLHGGVTEQNIREVVRQSLEHRFPTFSQSGSKEVEQGLLLSISRDGFKRVGLFHAAVIAKVLNGARPGDISQILEDSSNLTVNLKTAEQIGFWITADVLAAADTMYHEIPMQ